MKKLLVQILLKHMDLLQYYPFFGHMTDKKTEKIRIRFPIIELAMLKLNARDFPVAELRRGLGNISVYGKYNCVLKIYLCTENISLLKIYICVADMGQATPCIIWHTLYM